MKKSIKKVLAGVLACSMMSSTFTALAANTVEVKTISVWENNEVVATFAPTATDIRLTPEQMLEVTVSVTGDETDDVYASFLSSMAEGTLSNSTVQYVAQKAVGEDNTATFKFRPRASVEQGKFTAKSGATGATTAATFSYLVKEADKEMTLSAKKNSIKANETTDATFVISAADFTDEAYTGFSVYLDNTVLASDKYTIEKVENELVLTIKHENFADKVSGNKVAVTLKHDGYTDASGEIVITDAVWSVTLINNGGTIVTGENVTSYTPGTAVTLPTLTKDHYTFNGWYEKADFSTDKVTAIPADATGDKTYYAKFTADTYAINYELYGGTFAETPVSSYTYGEGVATLPTPTRGEYYDFDGWYTTSDFQGDKVETITAEDFDAKTFYAKWTGKKYNVTLNTNGGTIADGKNVTEYTYGIGATLPTKDDVTKTGYYFAGWYNNAEFEGSPVTLITVSDYDNKEYYAMWSENESTAYTITFVDYNGDELKKGTVAVGETPTCTAPTRESDDMYEYTFAGWKPEIAPVSDNATYTATYNQIARTYDVILNKDGGEIESGNDVTGYKYGVGATLPTLKKTGHKFDGWYEDAEFKGTAVTEIPVTATGNKEYFAKFTAETYTISYELNGGTIADEDKVGSYTFGVGAILPTPTKEHYTFDGWYENADFSTDKVTAISATETGNKNFYAKWVKNNEAVKLTVLDAFKDTVEVTKLVDTNTTITVSAKEGQTIPELKMYRATYTADKVLENVEEISANTLDENRVFTFTPQTLTDGETSKVMLWSNNNPVISAITE